MTRSNLHWRGDAPLPTPLAALGSERIAALASSIEAPDADAFPGDAARVLACSDFVFASCERDPAMLADLVSSGDLETSYPTLADETHSRQSIGERVDSAVRSAESFDALMTDLRRLRRREMARVAWRDIGGLADFEETVRDTSELADAIIDASLRRLHEWQCADLGVPLHSTGEPQQLVVLALGKLGASELNFSSDIDLIFTFPENGQTEGGPRSVDNDRFFIQLARKLIKALGEPTADGIVYRVDMRLRPFGSQGPLVLSFDALHEYYQTHGRDWERYALIRTRAVSGDMAVAAELLERLRPFVYRRYIDFGTLQSLRSLKVLMEQEVTRKGMEHSVKHGPGGIREVEFTGQAFQMVRGGRTPALRYRRLLTVLARLGDLGLLPAHAVESLSAAYRFLRATEHRLQQVDDRQEHILPQDDAGRARIAAGMGYASWEAFQKLLDHHRRNVDEQFAQVFGEEREVCAAGSDPLATLLTAAIDEATGTSMLEDAGFTAADEAWSIIARYRDTLTSKVSDTAGHERLARLAPDLLRAVAAQSNATTTLERVMTVIESIAKRSAYLALLAERPIALSQFVQLCAASPWIARLLNQHPVLFDELLDSRALYEPLAPDQLAEDIAGRLTAVDDPDREFEMDCLRQSKQANILRVAAADVSRRIPLMIVSDRLTEIAEAMLRVALTLAWRDIAARHGRPASMAQDAAFAPYAIIAYGKLGGIELGYGSDLDLVFVYDDDTDAMTTGAKAVDLATFYARLTQRIIHILTTMTPQGALYEVDPRLRPHGAKGMLVNTLNGLGEYLRDKAWTWEHQALVRARAVAGDPALGQRFARLRRDILLRDRDGDTLRGDVCNMRERMRTELGSRGRGGRFDLKQDAGGVADIEFMVQYGALRWASRLGADLDFTDNIRLLEGFRRAGLMPDEDATLLADAYRAYRGRMHELSLQESSAVVDSGEFIEYREAVTAIWNRLMTHDA